MKKTIAILLVLVIGMAGVFAANDAKVYLRTEIDAINAMFITAAEDLVEDLDDFTWEYNTYQSEFDSVSKAKDVDFNDSDPQLVGYLHVLTNTRLGINVNITATVLSYDDEDGDAIDTLGYKVSNVTSGGTPYVAGNSTPALFLGIDTGSGLRDGSSPIYVILDDSSQKTAGEYVGYITFDYSTND